VEYNKPLIKMKVLLYLFNEVKMQVKVKYKHWMKENYEEYSFQDNAIINQTEQRTISILCIVHCSLNTHLYCLGVANGCHCGAKNQTKQHILQEYPTLAKI
jgi:hypothetical protein